MEEKSPVRGEKKGVKGAEGKNVQRKSAHLFRKEERKASLWRKEGVD